MKTQPDSLIEVQKIRLINEITDILISGGVPPASVAFIKEVILSNMDEYDLKKVLVRHHRRQIPRFTYAQLSERYNITERQAKYMWKTRK